MQCPVCDVPLSISSREGVEIDFCPQCRGVWLDRGELDKVIERASAAMARPAAPAPAPAAGYGDRPRGDRYDERRPEYRDRDRDYDDRRRHGDDRHYDPRYDKKRKKRSFLDDIFDFD